MYHEYVMTDQELDSMVTTYTLAKQIPGIKIIKKGCWIWISGNTKPVKQELKKIGLRYAWDKKEWYWKPAGYHKRSRRTWSVSEIDDTFECQPL